MTGPESSDLEVQAALAGSRAWVYRAHSRSLGKGLVAKVQPQAPELLRREARVMESLPAGVAPRCYRLSDWLEQSLLLMEDCGSTRFPSREPVPCLGRVPPGPLRALLATLETVHAAGWAHGDLKPEHILFPDPERAVLIDWGLAEGGGLEPVSVSGQWSGTPLYMAPERFSGALPCAASDLYSLGVVLIEWLSGGFPPHWLDLPVTEIHRSVLSHWRSSPAADSPAGGGVMALADPEPARRYDGLERLKSLCR